MGCGIFLYLKEVEEDNGHQVNNSTASDKETARLCNAADVDSLLWLLWWVAVLQDFEEAKDREVMIVVCSGMACNAVSIQEDFLSEILERHLD